MFFFSNLLETVFQLQTFTILWHHKASLDPDPDLPKKQYCGSGSGFRGQKGTGIGLFRIPDLGSQIPNPYFFRA